MAASQQALTHAQKVTRLYRKALRNALDWCITRSVWRQEALEIRARFDANKDIKDIRRATILLEEGEKEYFRWIHPDPYIPPTAPDGLAWERNMAPPAHALEMTPDEIQWYEDVCKHGAK